jgi:hypothetical protein
MIRKRHTHRMNITSPEKGTPVKPTEHTTKTPHTATGLFALLGAFLHVRGTSAPNLSEARIRTRLEVGPNGGGRRDAPLIAVLGTLFVAVVLILFSFAPMAHAAGDVNTSTPCSPGTEASPGFHGYLPDCRAYELVTPPFIDGVFPSGPIGGKASVPQVSADGDHLLSLILGGLAETEALEQNTFSYGAYYVFSRTAAGWATESITPPDSLFPRSEFDGLSPDFTRSLWQGQLPPKPGEELPVGTPPGGTTGSNNGFNYPNNAMLAIREQAAGGKGRFTLVGPLTAPGHEPNSKTEGFQVEATSDDLSHILLRVNNALKQLWPGDQTGPPEAASLYEYQGTGETEPVLVGVSNEGSVAEAAAHAHDGYVNQAADLIGRCGTVLGGGGTGGYEPDSTAHGTLANAVSATGEIVYFTALACGGAPSVNELYARIGGVRTVDISEPSTGPGGDCAACLPENERYSAIYQGAAEDGSKVFFTSEQELLPGAEGNTLYEYNFDAEDPHERLTLIAPEVFVISAVSQDGTRVYFASTAVLTGQANGNGETATAGAPNLYVYDTTASGPSKPMFVTEQAAGETRTTRDGRYLVFTSSGHIAGTDDTSAIPQIFEYDADTGMIARVSVGQSVPGGSECSATHAIEERYGCDGNASSGSYYLPYTLGGSEGEVWTPTDSTSGLAVAADGSVEFESENALTPLAVSGKENVYEYEAGDVYLLSPGTEATSPINKEGEEPFSRALGLGETGQDAFFSTTESLVPQDTDSMTSWYDARSEGGFPAPAAPPACEGELCQGALPATPAFATPGSNTLTGSDNLGGRESNPEPKPVPKPAVHPKAKPCKKGEVRKHDKCVKTKAKKSNRATNDRRRRS